MWQRANSKWQRAGGIILINLITLNNLQLSINNF